MAKIQGDTYKVKGTPGDTAPGYLSGKVQKSVAVDATTKKLELSGDAATPGNLQYYGTNAGGAKGFFDLVALLAAGGGFKGIAVFATAGAGNWSVPAGVTSFLTILRGGGGGGGAGGAVTGPGAGGGGGGGGGGAYSVKLWTGQTPGASLAYSVGAGGAGGIQQGGIYTDGNPGVGGGHTFFNNIGGTTCIAWAGSGGAGGKWEQTGGQGGVGGASGVPGNTPPGGYGDFGPMGGGGSNGQRGGQNAPRLPGLPGNGGGLGAGVSNAANAGGGGLGGPGGVSDLNPAYAGSGWAGADGFIIILW